MDTYTQQAFVWIGFFLAVCVVIAIGLRAIPKRTTHTGNTAQQIADIVNKAHDEVRRDAERRNRKS